MSRHLKRISMPKTWPLEKKGKKYIVKSLPGAHKKESSIPLLIIIRDLLKLVRTSRGVKKVLNEKRVLVNERKVKEKKFAVGFYDIVSIPLIKKHFKMILTKKGKLSLIEIKEKEAKEIILRVEGKRTLKKGKFSIALFGGRNVLSKDNKIKVGDSLVLSLKDFKVKERLEFKEGAKVTLIGGKHIGEEGEMKKIRGQEIYIKLKSKEIKTRKDKVYVIKK